MRIEACRSSEIAREIADELKARLEKRGVPPLGPDAIRRQSTGPGYQALRAAGATHAIVYRTGFQVREMGRRIQGGVRSSDTAARLRGDELGVVLPQVGSRQEALATARRVSEECNGLYQLGDQTLPLGASIGVAVHPHDGNELESLL